MFNDQDLRKQGSIEAIADSDSSIEGLGFIGNDIELLGDYDSNAEEVGINSPQEINKRNRLDDAFAEMDKQFLT